MTDSSLDIYSLQPIVTHSEEHIVQRSLGGRLSKSGLIDKQTNDEFGGSIDASLDEALRAIRVIVNAKNTDGKPPRALTSVIGDDGKKYTIEAGGVMSQAPQITTEKLPAGGTFIRGSVPSKAALRNMLRKHAHRSGKDLDELVGNFMASAGKRVEAPPALPLGCELWDSAPYRATAKTACNLLAYVEPGLFYNAAFNGIRQYVLKGTRLDVHPVQAVDAQPSDGIGPLDHLVRVDVQRSGYVSALVVYFGHLGFVVQLGTLAPREPLSVAYRVDQLGRVDRFNDPRDLDVVVPSFAEAAAVSDEDFAKLAHAQLGRLLPVVMEIQRGLWIERVYEEERQRFFAEGGDREPTQDEYRVFSEAVAKRFVEELAPLAARASQRRRDAANAALDAPVAKRTP